MQFQFSLKASAASVGLIFGFLASSGCGGAVPAPKAFIAYHSPSGRFSCDYPQGWEAEGAGKPDSPNAWAKFSKGHAAIRVEADLAGSLFGDMAKSSGAMFGGEEEPPVARIHPMGERQMKEDFTNYTEREPKPFQSKGIGEGRRSTFIADQTLGGKVYGYRATLLANDRRITVICTCPATNWKTLKPAFETVVASVRQGGS
ncbi:hypothetical protein [Singulisphaera acidiphila]|uniref:PsbP C-terminal domain-containing protein n=1 Tax=Singulisphaera acidiphila (strain ATCC BAA-1392 / DSM 18658 / VKM B-2454 / MOB10) TaxID=886293 RepID=L0DL16_SINAD|nr:hypothetical protein [Singulisphaera acidiphila]AGA29525.1 hypothetical protein Sinac_5377 [Singulisphaera acidiphila DSM 18658]